MKGGLSGDKGRREGDGVGEERSKKGKKQEKEREGRMRE